MIPQPTSARRHLGPFELLLEVGYGGMGSVYVGRREGPGGFHKWVALKTIHPHLAKEEAFVDMFLDEARVAAAMQHPNVAQVFELGEDDGVYYLTMEYLHGEHLGSLLEYAGDGHDPRLVARIISLAAQGLHHAHEAVDDKGEPLNLVHRDISPQNIFLTYAGHVKVTDFGIARAEGRLLQTTDTGRIKGKCAYMAPEQITAQVTDPRADIFALAVVAWELLAGHRLFASDTDAETLLKIAQADIPALVDSRPDIPPALGAIVAKALERDRERRFDTALEVSEALEAFIADSGPPIATRQLGALMDLCFAEERADKERLLERGRDEAPAAPATDEQRDVETVEADAKSEVRVQAEAATVLAASTPESMTAPRATAATPGRRLVVTLVLLILIFSGVVVWLFPTVIPVSAVRVDSQPSGATVWLDSEPVEGSTPVILDEVARGRHSLRVSHEGYEPVEVSFDADRREMELSYDLQVTAEPVVAESPPAEDARTADAGASAEPAASAGRGRRRPRGGATAETRATAPAPAEVPAPTEAPAPTKTAAPVEMAATGRARLNLITSPWASVRINGRDFGRTPLYQRSVPAGTLRVELRARGEGPVVRRTLRAPVGETVSERVQLGD